MNRFFLTRRAMPLFAGALLLLFVVRLLKGDAVAEAASYSALWSVLTTAVFVGAHLHRQSRAQACALCDELPAREAHE